MRERVLFMVTPENDVTGVGRPQPSLRIEVVFDKRRRTLTVLADQGSAVGLRTVTVPTLRELLDYLSAEMQGTFGFPMPAEIRERFLNVFREFTYGIVPEGPT